MKFVLNTLIALALTWVALAAVSRLLEPTAVGPAAAPDPAAHPEALIRVYAANVWGVRGRFAVHSWIATKAANSSSYTLYQVIGWQLRRTGTARSITQGRPDRHWFGSPPILLHEVNGPEAEPLIEQVHDAALRYPYANQYKMLPGPNSNSFIQWILLDVPALNFELPAKALGKGWMIDNHAQSLPPKGP